MYKKLTWTIFIISLFLCPVKMLAQKVDRIQIIQQRLEDISVSVPGITQNVNLQLNNVPFRDYINALNKANKLSISIDPQLTFVVSETLNNVPAANVLAFLAKKYNLDINTVGSIIYITPYITPVQIVPALAKDIKVKYSQLENTLSLDLDNDSLDAVAKKISIVSGKNVQVPIAMQSKKVTGFFATAPFDAALEKLAFVNEIKMVKTSDNFYLFQPLDPDEQLYINGDKNTSSKRTYKPANGMPNNGGMGNSTTGNSSAIGLFVKTLNGEKLISVDATNVPIADLVKQASQESGKATVTYSDIKGNITLHLNDVSFDNFLALMFKGTDYTFHLENNIYMIGDSKLEGLRVSKAIQLQHRAIDTIVMMIPTEWKKGIEIKEFREQNTLLLSGASSRIAEIESLIKQLDILVPVVLIEVTLIDVHKSRTIATGISAGVSDSVKTGGTLLSGMDFTFSARSINGLLDKVGSLTSVNLGHVVPNFYVNLKALENNSNVDVRSVPKLTALNGHTATLSIGNKVYYKNTTQNVIPSSATTVTTLSNTYGESEANLKIAIKPLISGDDQVTLGINIDISDFTSLPTDGSPPPTATSKFQSSIRVNNEDMIVLGGIERTERSDSASGIPLLSRIPILKWIFSSKKKSNGKIVTLVFIKPTIMR
ncbi:secretin and TonB N-terminal domain-containing protein [Mucilaginibacter sp. UR6-11]|uniref:secretin and TonB N-terminal domain-containing protein n=1 Tax=Mucilaginibacter sp. UR6-11 TaxID=1435644 RepID=UPI001E42349F|nr:secretin and TonB N-terminal domain-containing protein [Mucilaginibacter sp. UR6-11]MCC8427239.1 secretin and TonB N-terminal domain-containing protein [Mucilaginibacter sp. UR6-11]